MFLFVTFEHIQSFLFLMHHWGRMHNDEWSGRGPRDTRHSTPWPQPVSLEQTPRFIVFAVSWPPSVRGVIALTRLFSCTLHELHIYWHFIARGLKIYVNDQRGLLSNAIRKGSQYFIVRLC